MMINEILRKFQIHPLIVTVFIIIAGMLLSYYSVSQTVVSHKFSNNAAAFSAIGLYAVFHACSYFFVAAAPGVRNAAGELAAGIYWSRYGGHGGPGTPYQDFKKSVFRYAAFTTAVMALALPFCTAILAFGAAEEGFKAIFEDISLNRHGRRGGFRLDFSFPDFCAAVYIFSVPFLSVFKTTMLIGRINEHEFEEIYAREEAKIKKEQGGA